MIESKLTWLPWAIVFVVLGLLLSISSPKLIERLRVERADHFVQVGVDLEDLQPIPSTWDDLKSHKVTSVVIQSDIPTQLENELRGRGLAIIFKVNRFLEKDEWTVLLARIKPGDALFSSSEFAPGYPGSLSKVATRLGEQGALLPLVEFANQKGIALLAMKSKSAWVRTHVLTLEERVLREDFRLWRFRLIRAVRERWSRLLIVRFHPDLSLSENLKLIENVSKDLEEIGMELSTNRPLELKTWLTTADKNMPARRLCIFFLSIGVPIVLFLLATKFPLENPWIAFVFLNFFAILAGISVYAIGSAPSLVFGVTSLRGIKLQLLIPLVGFVLVLFNRRQLMEFLEQTLKVKHVVVIGGFAVGFLALYLMRSGNQPLLPVTSWERHLRDQFEFVFGARPRFKEAFFGQPLLLLGLYGWSQRNKVYSGLVERWASVSLFLGGLSLVSIVNTFTHLHSPLGTSLLRSLHGVWIGALIGSILIIFLSKQEYEFKL